MKRSPLTRKSPMKRTRSLLKPSMRTGKAVSVWRTVRKALSDVAKLCRGQRCYILIDGLCCNDPATVVPCHSNQSKHGKGMGKKAEDIFTVPGCWLCHREIDQGSQFTREEKFALWDAAYSRWELVRDRLMGMDNERTV